LAYRIAGRYFRESSKKRDSSQIGTDSTVRARPDDSGHVINRTWRNRLAVRTSGHLVSGDGSGVSYLTTNEMDSYDQTVCVFVLFETSSYPSQRAALHNNLKSIRAWA
jgi:hypothetical protein